MGRMEPRDPDAIEPKGSDPESAPEPLLRALRALAPPDNGPDPQIFLAEARRHFAGARRRRRRLALAACASAVAALLLVYVGVQWNSSHALEEERSLNAGSAPLVGDLDRNQRLDILDAFALARMLDGADLSSPRLASADLSGDGRVDRADVLALARTAVSLDRGRGR